MPDDELLRRPVLDGLGHDAELDDAALLFLLQVGPALLDVDVVPGQSLLDGPRTVYVEGEVHTEVLECLPPELRPKALVPGIKPGPAPPGFEDDSRHSAVAAGEQAFEHAPLQLVLLDLHRAQPAAAA